MLIYVNVVCRNFHEHTTRTTMRSSYKTGELDLRQQKVWQGQQSPEHTRTHILLPLGSSENWLPACSNATSWWAVTNNIDVQLHFLFCHVTQVICWVIRKAVFAGLVAVHSSQVSRLCHHHTVTACGHACKKQHGVPLLPLLICGSSAADLPLSVALRTPNRCPAWWHGWYCCHLHSGTGSNCASAYWAKWRTAAIISNYAGKDCQALW